MCSKTNDPSCKGAFHIKFNPPIQEGICDLCGSELYQRKDDSLETIEKRLSSYEDETGIPLNNFYKNQNLKKIDGTQNPEKVFSDIETALSELFSHQ
jgi:adenylate kinase